MALGVLSSTAMIHSVNVNNRSTEKFRLATKLEKKKKKK
jgi:hypothetical protein